MIRPSRIVWVVAGFGSSLWSSRVAALVNLKTDWKAYTSPLVIPDVVDATTGGSLEFVIGESEHQWVADGSIKGTTYGYGLKTSTPTFPGPTLKVKKGVSISIAWSNELQSLICSTNLWNPPSSWKNHVVIRIVVSNSRSCSRS